MIWYKNLYWGLKAEKKKEKIFEMLEKGDTSIRVWLITLPFHTPNQLELFSSHDMKFWRADAQNLFVIGVAYGKKEAYSLLEQIVQEVWTETKSVDLNHYFSDKMTEQLETEG